LQKQAFHLWRSLSTNRGKDFVKAGGLLLLLSCLMGLITGCAWAQTPDPADQICPRLAPGSVAVPPADLSSQHGVLEVTFKVLTAVDMHGLVRYCFITDSGLQAPTLHLNPGDQLIIHLKNQLPAVGHDMNGMRMDALVNKDSTTCTANGDMTNSTNLHFHGLNASPACHQDEVIHTLIQPSQSFDYQVQIPPDEPPGLYWYHPHPHGFSAGQVRGGATGALIVEGIESLIPSLAGLPQRTWVLRDQVRLASAGGDPTAPSADISINFAPVPYPEYLPATVQTGQSQKEFWRVINASSITTFNLQYLIGGVPQQLQLVAIDGVPVGGVTNPRPLTQTNIELPSGARAEFVLTTPNPGDQAQLVTEAWNSGPDGIRDPARPIANIVSQSGGLARSRFAGPSAKPRIQKSSRFAGLRSAAPDVQRVLYFTENLNPPPGAPPAFFITVEGQTPAIFDMNQSPNIVVQRGAVESWTVENRTNEDHVFHIHQLHFQVLEINGQMVDDPAIRDTVLVPYWSGSGPYPSVKLSMDFRDPNISGTFVYHCHILDHEDLGMMGEIQVVPTPIETATALTAPSTNVNVGASVTMTATITSAPFGGAPVSGPVQFAVDGADSGSPVAVSNGQATFTTVFATGGKHSITAAYSGDTNYQASTSKPLELSAAGFALTASSPTVLGSTALATITVEPSGGFNSTVSLTCSVPADLAAGTCSLSPASLAAGGGQATLIVHATTPSASKHQSGVGVSGGVIASMLACLLIMVPSRKRNLSIRLSLLLFACLTMGVACTDSQWHESGTYNIAVKATGNSNGAPIQNTVTVPVAFH
jgi:FtsP/CotA-like multicopper oxidase with cupredoxin domain